MTSMDDSYDLNLAAALLHSNSTDIRILLKVLCDGLAETLGDRLRVQRGGSRFKRSDDITTLELQVGSSEFKASVDGANLRCVIGHVSGGIRIRNETVDVSDWVVRLLGALRSETHHSEAARRALENLVIGGNA